MTIKEWLHNNGSFEEGLALFLKHSRNRNKINYLSRKRDPVKLRYEMEKLSECADPSAATLPLERNAQPLEKPSDRLKVIHSGGIRYQDMPVTVQEKYQEACLLYKRMRSLHEKMKLVTTDSQRLKARDKLTELNAENRSCWAAIDQWAAQGTLPVEKSLNPENDSETMKAPNAKAVGTARVSIGRDLKAIEKNPDEHKREELIARLQANVGIIHEAGCTFGKNAAKLAELGLIPAE